MFLHELVWVYHVCQGHREYSQFRSQVIFSVIIKISNMDICSFQAPLNRLENFLADISTTLLASCHKDTLLDVDHVRDISPDIDSATQTSLHKLMASILNLALSRGSAGMNWVPTSQTNIDYFDLCYKLGSIFISCILLWISSFI